MPSSVIVKPTVVSGKLHQERKILFRTMAIEVKTTAIGERRNSTLLKHKTEEFLSAGRSQCECVKDGREEVGQ